MTQGVTAQVRKDIFQILFLFADVQRQGDVELIDKILSIPVSGKTISELIEGWISGKLRELDPDQSLPKTYFAHRKKMPWISDYDVEVCAQQDMLKEHWVKVLKEEK